MSYYTHVTFDFSDEPPTSGDVSKVARSWLTDQNLYAVDDVLEDFLRGWTEGETDFKGLMSQDISELMTQVSLKFPDILFYVRGMGEEFDDVWLRKFEGGKAIFELGPFDEA